MWDDLDGLLDFGVEEYEPVEHLASKETPIFDLHSGARRLNARCKLPEDGESVRVISYAGGFSSASVVVWIAELYEIYDMHVTTLRVGKKEIDAMRDLHDNGRLRDAKYILSGIAKENTRGGKDYGYTDYFEDVCRGCGWSWEYAKNHSKVILLDTGGGKYTVETSSNFNENPKIEQFCISKSEDIYSFYLAGLFG